MNKEKRVGACPYCNGGPITADHECFQMSIAKKQNRLYTARDTQALGQLYMNHVEAMTAEDLHSKSAIAAELAWRDQEISLLRTGVSAQRLVWIRREMEKYKND